MDEIQTVKIEAKVHGRYLLRPVAAGEPAPLLVGFHGYGENAERLFEAMIEIPGLIGWHVAVVQALHPFYNTRTGEVVASWMTKLDRELAIEDNLRYVGDVVADIGKNVRIGGPTIYLGFSQGTAMAYRAAASSTAGCDAVIALAGDVPAEIGPDSTTGLRVLIGRGTSDQWYDEAKMETDLARLRVMGAEAETCVFEGGHEWTPAFRMACREFLEGTRAS
jgi:predicted esterase